MSRRSSTTTSAPALAQRRGCARGPLHAVRRVRTMTGPACSVASTRAVGGVRSRRSKTTRVSGPLAKRPAAVSCGSSASSVPTPTRDRVHLGAEPVRVRVGVAPRERGPHAWRGGDAAVRAQRHLQRARTGRPAVIAGQERRVQRGRLRVADADVHVDALLAQVRRCPGRRPAGWGPPSPRPRARMPASTTRAAQGPVRPVWLQGSSVQ